ncbi:MAG: HD domain-containing protein [Chloroflexota bacterium]
MKLPSIYYRARQFGQALKARTLSEADLAEVQAILTPEQMTLFSRLQPSEQSHSLRVLRTLEDDRTVDPDLKVAALLHDIGKIRYPLRLWQRVFVVLGKALWPKRAQAWGEKEARGWQTPFVVAAQHPAWGAEIALEAGVSPRASRLIRAHQNSIPAEENLENRLLAALQKADQQH